MTPISFVLLMLGLAVGAWVGGHLLLWVASPLLFLKADTAFTNGLVIVVPKALRAKLSHDELAAVKAHEWGHIRLGHPYLNLLNACLNRRRSVAEGRLQELQADDYAASAGHGAALACVLRRSVMPFDLYRAKRLASA